MLINKKGNEHAERTCLSAIHSLVNPMTCKLTYIINRQIPDVNYSLFFLIKLSHHGFQGYHDGIILSFF